LVYDACFQPHFFSRKCPVLSFGDEFVDFYLEFELAGIELIDVKLEKSSEHQKDHNLNKITLLH
jgi:hypothetical protein